MAFDTTADPQFLGSNGYTVDASLTTGDEVNGYVFPGIPDGIGAFALDSDTVRFIINHEFNDDDGYLYPLNPGTPDELLLSGTRMSFVDVNKQTFLVEDAGLAYERAFDLEGNLITSADQIPNSAGSARTIVDGEGNIGFEGFGRFCSGQFFEAGTFGLVDDIYVAGEEIDDGLGIVLDTNNNDLYLAPYLGRGAWENATFVDTGTDNFTGLLWTDDSSGAFVYLWVGEKGVDSNEDGELDLLERNGLSEAGYLYTWVPDAGNLVDSVEDGSDFTFTDSAGNVFLEGEVDVRDRIADDSYGSGKWVELTVKDESKAGTPGYDEFGFALQNTLLQEGYDKGALGWSRPEDIDVNPANGTEFVVANTGSGFAEGFDFVGDVMVGDIDFSSLQGLTSYTQIADGSITTTFDLVYDGDQDPNQVLRSPDNLDWATDGFIYVNEDRAVGGIFGAGAVNPSEAQIVRIDPNNGNPADGGALQVAEANRAATLPEGQIDRSPTDVGNWESSGIVDVSELFGAAPGEIFAFDVQAHSVAFGAVGDPTVPSSDPTSDDLNLVQGGQFAFLVAPKEGTSGNDNITGIDLGQVMLGLAGNDTVAGGQGDDAIYGGTGDDLLRGDKNVSRAGTVIRGGNDFIDGGEGSDRISGKNGNDTLIGAAGNDSIWGDGGDDVIRGGLGNDFLDGDDNDSNGSDIFVLATGEGTDTISDFAVGTDFIGLADGLAFGDLSFSGNRISAGGNVLAVLNGVNTTALSAADFLADFAI